MKLLKSIRCAVLAAMSAMAISPAAHAGVDALVMVNNLSPYKVDVSFPTSFQDCWNDAGAEGDSNIADYYTSYLGKITSDSSYQPYLKLYQTTYNLPFLNQIPSTTMAGTTQSLPAAADGKPVQHIAFRGEASANLFAKCKLSTSSRGFVVTLTDANGVVKSRRHYVLTDPPDSEWTLTRMKPFDEQASGAPTLANTVPEKTILLGGGGRSSATEIALTAGMAILTVASIGQAGYELAIASRAISYLNSWALVEGRQYLTLEVGSFLFGGGVRGGASLGFHWVQYGIRPIASYGNRVILSTVTLGMLHFFSGSLDQSIAKPQDMQHFQPDFEKVVDFSSPELYVNAGLKDDRSICAYQGSTFGITECRLVGIDLSVLPDGSLSFIPLPSVGGGISSL
ncbi:hypothetical protein EN871_32605 [bacterium M00.F.Ca.ET.228.01.1.1]|nr:hypothetical protein EN871_32605 [bacterium M00.F.Ca.ET.228.01.1.1]TGR95201.1 hypothetical protein EN834_32590 [bacterium M00.F.Ca.ET.191.01.1.1]TGT95998.1 hypothetical protein EN798_32600 [bacterium M00.F.Ca.ET.155.01.1.1]